MCRAHNRASGEERRDRLSSTRACNCVPPVAGIARNAGRSFGCARNEVMICGPKVARHKDACRRRKEGSAWPARWLEITWHIIVKHQSGRQPTGEFFAGFQQRLRQTHRWRRRRGRGRRGGRETRLHSRFTTFTRLSTNGYLVTRSARSALLSFTSASSSSSLGRSGGHSGGEPKETLGGILPSCLYSARPRRK